VASSDWRELLWPKKTKGRGTCINTADRGEVKENALDANA